ncbi:hypothetical protein COCMIDRAFT_26683 [Bipolaris oryzae ATCC 44560]|uniref:Uncharacterized protein n=1 Tax=Bipolaris oryzae ATCC 44560 TaxID=930090 RepID=W6Z5P3_COCMI|nr:uncharacterized protein COCMIDRAFT_26683 [Bipolaris oryzae ATCC 44560]EUC45098.1 hypothetical protein COCMIDRAFT_26683 [Bipolaris oryzae ATCC 44560]
MEQHAKYHIAPRTGRRGDAARGSGGSIAKRTETYMSPSHANHAAARLERGRWRDCECAMGMCEWACGSCALWPLIVTGTVTVTVTVTVAVAVAVTCPTTSASIVGDEYTPTYMHRILGACHGPCPSCCTATLANAAFCRRPSASSSLQSYRGAGRAPNSRRVGIAGAGTHWRAPVQRTCAHPGLAKSALCDLGRAHCCFHGLLLGLSVGPRFAPSIYLVNTWVVGCVIDCWITRLDGWVLIERVTD